MTSARRDRHHRPPHRSPQSPTRARHALHVAGRARDVTGRPAGDRGHQALLAHAYIIRLLQDGGRAPRARGGGRSAIATAMMAACRAI
ncbi:hypothetical protein GUJ93_ZPchr0011g28476 [Zizania palustris]|uniref:Uncharacterized protein n=1 Tax=Zizania palustris TaxID=103762 RepID=A0A8J5WJ86_ZIZPA|nr:hypothetical protein GUJ93_ZPchr0011g28476 [Zizania palustris]